MPWTFIAIGALAGLTAIVLGALGAHVLPERPGTAFQTAGQYHFFHALALLLVGALGLHFGPAPLLRWGGLAFIAGLVLFCGGIYLQTLLGWHWIGPVIPLGGLSLMVGWCCLGCFALGPARAGR